MLWARQWGPTAVRDDNDDDDPRLRLQLWAAVAGRAACLCI